MAILFGTGMKSAMILFPGSNCDGESHAFLKQKYGIENVAIIWHRDRFDPTSYDLIFLPGGFSYGDYLRAGACAASSPAMQDVLVHAKRGGYVVGVCNGFQILLETQLLPGVLIRNELGVFVCEWRDLEINTNHNLKWSLGDKNLRLPIANKYGRFYMPKHIKWDPEKQIVLKYKESEEPAGITNTAGNILGMMPHPERASFDWQNTQDGTALLPGDVSWH
jgi:phosphoribosylformylglycinamidine synthase subunit PurQ / glutaminase